MNRRQFISGALFAGASVSWPDEQPVGPKVRALTAFLKLDRARYREQVEDTLKLLRRAKGVVEAAGYPVETIRIATQPFPEYTRGLTPADALGFFREYDALAMRESFAANIGPAMMADGDDPEQAQLLGQILAVTKSLKASLIVAGENGIQWKWCRLPPVVKFVEENSPGSAQFQFRRNGYARTVRSFLSRCFTILAVTKSLKASLIVAGENGIQWKCVQAAARVVKFVEENSPGSAGNFNFAATAMLAPYGPFYPGAYHLGEGLRFAIGTEGANVVARAFAQTAGDVPLATERLKRELSAHAVALEKLAQRIESETGWTYMGIDATPAPLREVSIGAAIEKFTGARFGSSGTMTAAAVITKAVQSVPVKRIGFSGLMLPVMEDSLLAERWTEGAYDVDGLLAYSAVCGTGLDTIPMAGDATPQQIERILGDVATLAVKWKKPLTARLLPVKGKKTGERTNFDDPFLVNTTIRAIR